MEQNIELSSKGENFDTLFVDKSGNFIFENIGCSNPRLKELWFSAYDLGEIYHIKPNLVETMIETIFNKCELFEEESTKLYPNFGIKDEDQIVKREKYYNLKVAVLVGMKIDTTIGRKFRRWSSDLLSDYLINGYALNIQRINTSTIVDIKEKVHNLVAKGRNNELVLDNKKVITELARSFSRAFELMHNLSVSETTSFYKADRIITYLESRELIDCLKSNLNREGAFGIEKESHGSETKFLCILRKIMTGNKANSQCATIQMRAAQLFYQIIKEQPFIDGNKRIGSMMFLYYLKISGMELLQLGPNTLAAMALLVSFSKDDKQDTIIKLIVNLMG